MPTSQILAFRVVDQALQERFAEFSGDRNPMHMDLVAARRTQAGAPVVHGVPYIAMGARIHDCHAHRCQLHSICACQVFEMDLPRAAGQSDCSGFLHEPCILHR